MGGETILLTGSSGFLGKVVLASLLRRDHGSERLILLLRAPDEAAAAARLRDEVLTSEALAGVRSGLLEEAAASGRIRAVAGDLSRPDLGAGDRDGWGAVDTVIHCAATVSFEEPLDHALDTNAMGPVRLLEAVRGAGAEPHFVHVSTAYAADCRVDVVREAEYAHPAVAALEPEEMLEAARWWREAAETESEAKGLRARFAAAAARDAATRADVEPGERAEELRQRWVRERLAERGRRYAVKAGWPDTYALTKALGERLLVERSERTTIVRPSIIESSLRQPRPGWLEGIKVADPLVLAYAARGLTHLAGRATNLIDIVPVDCVANACVAAALYPPSEPLRVLAVGSTARNPLEIGQLATHIKAYFRRQPLRHKNGTELKIGDLRFVDRGAAIRATRRRQLIAAAGARAAAAPFVPNATEAKLRKLSTLAAQITRMVKIYGPYTELSCVFDDANTCALAAQMSSEDRAQLPFDTAAIDWTKYLEEVHLPEVRRMAER
jgi:thioester reductase-like protein